MSLPTTTNPDPVHAFAVFDGFGGGDIARHCATSLSTVLQSFILDKVSSSLVGLIDTSLTVSRSC